MLVNIYLTTLNSVMYTVYVVVVWDAILHLNLLSLGFRLNNLSVA
jgi:hypothetical protein